MHNYLAETVYNYNYTAVSFQNNDEEIKKKGCKWLLTSHETITLGQLVCAAQS